MLKFLIIPICIIIQIVCIIIQIKCNLIIRKYNKIKREEFLKEEEKKSLIKMNDEIEKYGFVVHKGKKYL